MMQPIDIEHGANENVSFITEILRSKKNGQLVLNRSS